MESGGALAVPGRKGENTPGKDLSNGGNMARLHLPDLG